MDLFKRFVFEQAFNRKHRTVTGGEQTETVQCSPNTNRFESRFSPPPSEACLTTSVFYTELSRCAHACLQQAACGMSG